MALYIRCIKFADRAAEGSKVIKVGREGAAAFDPLHYVKIPEGVLSETHLNKLMDLCATGEYEAAWMQRVLENENIFLKGKGVFKNADELIDAMHTVTVKLGSSPGVVRLIRRLRINHPNVKGFAAELKYASESDTLVGISRDMKPDKGIDVDVEDAYLNQLKYTDIPVGKTKSVAGWLEHAVAENTGKTIRLLIKKGNHITADLENFIESLNAQGANIQVLDIL